MNQSEWSREKLIVMANIEQSLEVLDSWEGGYANNPRDPGGETYCGISRKMWPNWAGWTVLDSKKRLFISNTIRQNERFSELNQLVKDFYTDNFWNKQSFAQLNNQDICDKIFQHYVNMGDRAINFAQLASVHTIKANNVPQGFTTLGLIIDGKMGPHSIAYINNILIVQRYLDDYIDQLINYYEVLIQDHPQLKVFEHEWMLRAKTIGKRPVGV